MVKRIVRALEWGLWTYPPLMSLVNRRVTLLDVKDYTPLDDVNRYDSGSLPMIQVTPKEYKCNLHATSSSAQVDASFSIELGMGIEEKFDGIDQLAVLVPRAIAFNAGRFLPGWTLKIDYTQTQFLMAKNVVEAIKELGWVAVGTVEIQMYRRRNLRP